MRPIIKGHAFSASFILFSISLSKLLNHFMLRSHSHLRPLQSLFKHSNSPSVLDSYTFYLLYYGLRGSYCGRIASSS